MREDLLREIAEEYLLPFFSGATLENGSASSTPREEKVAFRDPLSISFKISRNDRYRLTLVRRQAFTTDASSVIKEIDIVRSFVDIIFSMENELDSALKDDLLSTFQRRVVARAIRGSEHEDVVLSGIDQMASWGNRLYEGAPISAAIGFRHTTQSPEISLKALSKHDFSAVLSNGLDTIMSFNFQGNFVAHEAMDRGESVPSFCPIRQSNIAEWTTRRDTRVAISLNRLAEILVFRDQQMLFARRSGRWHFLTHDPVISQMRIPKNRNLRLAIYETCLDASFARTGACIGVISQEHHDSWHSVVSEQDRFSNERSEKAVALRLVTRNQRFADLDRRTRQELAAIDGATIVSHQGEILAVGAILRIAGGSSGGSRLAAAKALSRLGLGIKVSQDGGITGYRAGNDDPVFRVM
jgi:hypothetical protein